MQTQSRKDGIAIIGVGCRFPGGVNDTEAFWKLLMEKGDAVCEVPKDRWNVERYYDAEPNIAGKSVAKKGGFINGLEFFDAQFFGISPREAPYIDPQQRLLLETAWEAMEEGGLILDLEKGTDVGVFVGVSHNDYQIIQGTPWDSAGISAHSPTGSAHSIAANRISYCFNLLGPSVAMDTACSSALTAVHAACEHLWNGRGRAALAGGVTVMITPGGFIGFSQASMLSPDGACKAFDASANGFVRGEGAGMVLLKRLSDALADGDVIQGVIRGTCLNQDGHTNGIMLPCPDAQARLVRDACIDAGVHPIDIGFVEAHGTGTAVGDPIEAHALAEALCQDRSEDAPLPIGSVKTNIGHLETAAGVAGLVKALLVLKHRKIPGSLHFTEANPNIDFKALKMRVPTEVEDFPEPSTKGGLRMVGVNSFGFGGANAHVILSEAPAAKHVKVDVQAVKERPWPFVLSARSDEALLSVAYQMSDWLEQRIKANGSSPLMADLLYTLGARRNHHQHRLTLVGGTPSEILEELNGFVTGEQGQKIRTAFTPRRESAARVGLVMSGQGPQWWGMGRELYKHEPVFRSVIDACDRAMKPHASFSLIAELNRAEADSQMGRTEVAQPSIFAMQVALAALWKSWGIEPHAIVGHSVGEIAAACVAGVLSLEEAARVIVMRAKFMENCARGAGTMLAVGLNEEEALAVIARHDPRSVSIAAFNGPRSLTLSGPKEALQPIATELEAEGVFARFVRVDHPFHHAFMQPAADELTAALKGLEPQAEKVPFFSTVTGARCSGTDCVPQHWGNGIRQAVMFAPAVDAMAELGVDVWLEISAHPALAMSIQECLAAKGGAKPVVVSSTRRDHEHQSMLNAAMDLHLAGVDLNFAGMTPSRQQLRLPAYPWDKKLWWNEASDWKDGRLKAGGRGLLDTRLPGATPTWTARLDNRHMAYLKDHKVESHVVFPAAAYVDMILEAGVQYFEGRPFVVEDFEIRKALILPEQVADVMLEVTYDPQERTFTLQSKFTTGAAWSVHVVGSMRGERVESTFTSSTWDQVKATGEEMKPWDLTQFYDHMSNLGLRYGEEFRAVRELSAAAGEAQGRVALSEASATRAAEYPLHPVLLDAALHVFSAGAKTVEDRKARTKLPVRFARITYLRSPGASALVKAGVQQFNEEFIEGGLTIYDEAGQPCVKVDGFRAISMAAAKKFGSANAQRDLVYHIDWQRIGAANGEQSKREALKPLPLKAVQQAARETLDEVVELRGRKVLEATMVAEEKLAVAVASKGLCEMGVSAGVSFDASLLKVAKGMRMPFERLCENLADAKLLTRDADKADLYRALPTLDRSAAGAEQVFNEFVRNYPGHLPEAQLVASTCGELGPILRGEKEAVHVLFGGANTEWLEHFYGDGLLSSHWMASIASAVAVCERNLPEGRGLRILEVGAGTGGLSAQVLPLLKRGLHQYVFSDVSAAFFTTAGQKLAAFPEVEFKIYNLDRSPVEQELELESFDLVIGTNVIHAVEDVKQTLKYIESLLVPGGTLVFMDVATPHVWTDSVFGLTSGWWHLKDRDLRPHHPLLQRKQWEKVLKDAGFAETASLPGMKGPKGEGQVGVLGRKAWSAPAAKKAAAIDDSPTDLTGTSWLLFADEAGLSNKLTSRLKAGGANYRTVRKGDKFSAKGDSVVVNPHSVDDFISLLEKATQGGVTPDRMVYLWALDEESVGNDADASLLGTDALLHLTQALEQVCPAAKLRIDFVTRGAQAAGEKRVELSVAQTALIGLFRVVLSEHPQYRCRGIDLSSETKGLLQDVDLLWQELLLEDAEREIALRGEARYVQRIDRGLPTLERELEVQQPLRLESKERGMLDTLRLSPFEKPVCGPEEVWIEVKAAGMNFRDVLKALALYPAETPDARIFGDEVGGIVRAVGEKVSHVAVGDKVFGLAVFGMATHTLARASDVRKMPDRLTFEQAATLPVVFMTAWHSLYNVARMRKGETILVHAGAGGVGMAAIQIARHLGVDVIASAGSPSKRVLLLGMGVKHVIDSRRGDFADAVMELTNHRGVDVVLNALAAEAIPMGLSCLAQFGRFLEIGKRDIYQNSRIPLWPLRKNASFHVIAMDAVFGGDEALTRDLMATLADLVEKGEVDALPYRAFPASRVDAAFRLMAQGKHIGKVIVNFTESLVPRRVEVPAKPFAIRADGRYLITGAFGGFGRVLAQWLVDGGARNLVLTGRSGAATPEAEAFVEGLQAQGAEVEVIKADVGNAADVNLMMVAVRAAELPLLGVFHLAMVIDDVPMSVLNRERMRVVLAPKAYGAWLLHEATKDLALDAFVMFSSISSVFGNPAQGNYAAANAFLDALAHHRQAQGLVALAINWGVLGGEGYVARNERVAEFLARQGTTAIQPNEVLALLDGFLSAGVAQAAAIRVDWAKWRQSFRGLQENPLLEHIFAAGVESEEGGAVTGDWKPKIEAAAPEERAGVIAQAVREVVAGVLRLKPEGLRDDQPLTDLGLDSLMGVEIENSIESTIGVALPPTSLMRARTIGQIAVLISEHMGGGTGGGGAAPAKGTASATGASVSAVEVAATSAEEVDFEALSDEDFDGLLTTDEVGEGDPDEAKREAQTSGELK